MLLTIRHKVHMAYLLFSITMICSPFVLAKDSVQFNTELLDLNDRKNIDLDKFSHENYIMPGGYTLKIKLNNSMLPEQKIFFIQSKEDKDKTIACLNKELVSKIGFKSEIVKKLIWQHNNECVDVKSIPGTVLSGDLSSSTLTINIPQAYLDYRTENWDPPSLWDDGIAGIFIDYNITAKSNRSAHGQNSYTVNANGLTGANLGVWRFRADWQSRLNHVVGSDDAIKSKFDWTRVFVFRAIKQIQAKLSLGEEYLNSNLFDSFRFTGASLRSDVNMLPPNLRGYAPEVTGIANTNATIIISQNGRILYQTQVAAGPFRIQDLSDVTNGKLDVRIEEQDGAIREFQVNTATIPYLTRPGSIRYKFSAGKPTSLDHHSEGDLFASGEFSWGVSNGWSLFGGSLNSQNYHAVALGIGKDLLSLGAISFDITQSYARLSNKERHVSGGSYRVNYSKRFEQYDSQIQFAGYRFSEREFMSMSDYLGLKKNGDNSGNSKELYTVSLNKNFTDLRMSLYFNYNHQTYWDKPNDDRYNVMLNKIVDVGSLKNINLSLSLYRNIYNKVKDDGAYISISMPWNNGANIGYSMSTNRSEITNQATYYDRLNDRTSYQLSLGNDRKGGMGSAYITHDGDNSSLTANVSYNHNSYTSFGLGARGGFTVTPYGADMHRVSALGATRLLVDTDAVANIPMQSRGMSTNSNIFGKAVISDINSYYRNSVNINLNEIPDNSEVIDSVAQVTLTEGAIGYRKFNVISGKKMMLTIQLEDSSNPPFGAQLFNSKGMNVGIMNDDGQAYVSGIVEGEKISIHWNNSKQCQFIISNDLQLLEKNKLVHCK